MRKLTILVGMSGGVDSSVAAYLLKKQGFNVVGITFKMWNSASRCCDIKDIEIAKKVSFKIGIPHYVVDLQKEFKKNVVDYFVKEYIHGKTPNPCVVCNEKIKFAKMFEKLKTLNFDYLATGHYAKIVKIKKNFFLAKAKDKNKSQEYFLARLPKEFLKKIIFPLGDLTKNEVKKIAQNADIFYKKEESQEVCFIKKNEKYFNFVMQNLKSKKDFSGNIIDKEGKILGKHNCYFKYTIGQREGLGISDKTPYYVIKIDPKDRNVIVSKKIDLLKNRFLVENVYLYLEKPDKFFSKVKTRYKSCEIDAEINLKHKNEAEIILKNPQIAITPGQLAVFYNNEIVEGSAWIKL